MRFAFPRCAPLFQSTPPVKAATCGFVNVNDFIAISIHAAREGGDIGGERFYGVYRLFQSTPPVKAATYRLMRALIYAVYFNPRRP